MLVCSPVPAHCVCTSTNVCACINGCVWRQWECATPHARHARLRLHAHTHHAGAHAQTRMRMNTHNTRSHMRTHTRACTLVRVHASAQAHTRAIMPACSHRCTHISCTASCSALMREEPRCARARIPAYTCLDTHGRIDACACVHALMCSCIQACMYMHMSIFISVHGAMAASCRRRRPCRPGATVRSKWFEACGWRRSASSNTRPHC